MKIQMPDGSELEIAKNMCPKCYIDVDREEGTATKMVQHPAPKADKYEIDMLEIWICTDCRHKQIVVVDNPNYEGDQ